MPDVRVVCPLCQSTRVRVVAHRVAPSSTVSPDIDNPHAHADRIVIRAEITAATNRPADVPNLFDASYVLRDRPKGTAQASLWSRRGPSDS
jgi:hypothetical protein